MMSGLRETMACFMGGLLAPLIEQQFTMHPAVGWVEPLARPNTLVGNRQMSGLVKSASQPAAFYARPARTSRPGIAPVCSPRSKMARPATSVAS